MPTRDREPFYLTFARRQIIHSSLKMSEDSFIWGFIYLKLGACKLH